MNVFSKKEFLKGRKEFESHEKREAMYKVADFLIKEFWGKPTEMADALGVLLLTWNQAFYRYGSFDFFKLEKCIADNFDEIKFFNNREIFSLSSLDETRIRFLFQKYYKALRIASGKKKGIGSPVAVAKALHILAPKFFPLWDDKIAKAYNCYYCKNPAEKYISFCKITKNIAEKVKKYNIRSDKTIIKLIDEYNYSKYTKKWT